MSFRSWASAVAAAFALTLLSTIVPGSVRMTYSDIMGCEAGCDNVAAGFPIAFVVDYPGLSPVDSADLMGVVLGLDRMLWGRAAANFALWLGASMLVAYTVELIRARAQRSG